jgi:hypothetical protein
MMMMTTTTNNRRRTSSLCVAKYIKNIQQTNKRTAEEYEYRLSRFEKCILLTSQEQQQQQLYQQNQEPKVTITSLDQVVEELKRSSSTNKIDPYDLLSSFVAYLQEEEGIQNPNTIRYFVITA